MPDKFENATLLLRIRLPSTLIHLYPHKKIHENGTFWKRFPEWSNLKTILFCISVDGELFVSATFRIRWHHFFHVIYLPKDYNMAKNMIFSVFLTIFIFFNRLIRAKYCFITSAHKEYDTTRATQRCRPCKKIHFWIGLALQMRGGTTS